MIDEMKEYTTRVYLAGPFFNEEQLERISYIETKLDMYGLDVFSPRHASLIKPGCSKEDMIETFKGNVTHIDKADLVLAVLDGNDTGTIWEAGYAYAKQVPTIYFNETRPKDKGPNLMLAESTGLPYIMNTDQEDARETLSKILRDLSIGGVDFIKEKYKPSEFKEVE